MRDNKTADKTFRQKAEMMLENSSKLKSNKSQVKLSESEMIEFMHELEVSKIQIELQSKEIEEREKELRFHYKAEKILKNTTLSPKKNFQKVVDILPDAFQFPEITAISLKINGWIFNSKEFIDSNIFIETNIQVENSLIGFIKACYKDDGHQKVSKKFLKEEKNLLKILSIRLSEYYVKYLNHLEIKKNEDKYQSLVDSINEVIYEITAEGTLKYINNAVYHISGYHPNELIGKSYFENIYPNDLPLVYKALSELGNEKYIHVEFRFLTKDGKIKWVRSSTKTILENGIAIGGRGVLIDIHETKLAQILSAQNEKKLQFKMRLQELLVDISNKYINLPLNQLDFKINNSLDDLGKFIGADRFYIFDYDFDQQTCSNTYEWCAEGIEAQIDELQNVPFEYFPEWLNAHCKGETLCIEDVLALDPEDNLRIILEPQGIKSLVTVPIMNAGKCLGFTGFDAVKDYHIYTSDEVELLKVFAQILVNIKNRIKSQHKLEESNRKFKLLINNLNGVIYRSKFDGEIWKFEYISKGIFELTGYTENEFFNNPKVAFKNLIHKDDQKIERASIEKHLANKSKFEFEYRIIDANGKERWVAEQGHGVYENDKLIAQEGFILDITEKKNFAADLILKDLRYVELIEHSNTVIWEVDMNGLYTYVSPSSESVYGHRDDELIGKKYFYDIAPKEFREDVKKYGVGGIRRGDELLNYDNAIEKKDGTIIWVTTNGKPYYDKDNNIIGYRGSDIVITERKLAEEELRKNEEELNEAQEIAKMGSWYLNLITDETTLSKNYYKLVEREEKDTIKKSDLLFPLIYKDDRANIDKIVEIIKETKIKATFNVRLIMPNGSPKWFKTVIVPVIENDVVIALKGVKVDISEKKEQENELKKLSIALEQSPASMVITDLEARINYVSPAFTEITGYTDNEVLGKKASILKSGNTKDAVYKDLWKTITSGKVWRGELENRRKDGSYYWERISITPILNENNEISNYFAIKEDISDFKNALERIKDLNLNLEVKVEERTRELEEINTVLIQEIEERNKLSKALSESEYNYRNLVENINEVVFQTNTNGLWLFLNQSWEEITGFSVDESIGELFVNFVHPEDRQFVINLITPVLNREMEYCRFEARYLTKAGGLLWMEVFVSLTLDKEDQIIGTYGTLQDITEEKEAEVALKIEKQRLASIIEGTNVGTWEWNIKTGETKLNERWANILGYSLEEISPTSVETFRTFAHPEDNHKSNELLEQHFQGITDYYSFESRMKHKNGSWIWVLARGRVSTWDTDGKPLLMSGTHLEITNRKKAEEALEIEKQRLASIIEGTNVGTWEWNIKTGATKFNERWANILGYTLEEISPISIDTWIKFSHPEDLLKSNKLLEQHFQGVTNYYSFESRMKHKNGSWVWVLDRGKVNKWDKDGKPLIMAGTHQNITKKKEAEEELNWNKTLLELMSNSSPLGFLVVDNRTDDILYFNQRFLQIWEIEELKGQMKNGELKNNDIIPYCVPLLVDVPAFSESCKPLQFEENRLVLEDEIAFTNNRTIHRYTTQIRGENDEYFGRFYIFEDITEQKNIHEEIINSRNEAIKATNAKSEFLSRMSHELRTPLNSILGFAQLMKMSNLDEEYKTNVNYIYSSGKHLLNLINEVLDISRIEAGRISLHIQPIQVLLILNETLDLLKPQLSNKDINLKLFITPLKELYVNADIKRLKQVLINILDNAIKYNKIGGDIKISSKILPMNNEGVELLRILITDTGIGISKDNISKIFNPFERVGAERTEVEGTGLGLSVVKKLMDSMNGTIGAKSIKDKGTTFWVELPLVKNGNKQASVTFKEAKLIEDLASTNSELDLQIEKKQKSVNELLIANEEIQNRKKLSSKNANDLPKKKGVILYAENNELNIKLVENIINENYSNINLIIDNTGSEVLQLAIENQPDLILLDLDLPDMAGKEILQLLLKEEKTKTIPIVIVTGSINLKQRERFFKKGIKEYINKPIDISFFLKVLEPYITKK